jgi:hypothetical protein
VPIATYTEFTFKHRALLSGRTGPRRSAPTSPAPSRSSWIRSTGRPCAAGSRGVRHPAQAGNHRRPSAARSLRRSCSAVALLAGGRRVRRRSPRVPLV